MQVPAELQYWPASRHTRSGQGSPSAGSVLHVRVVVPAQPRPYAHSLVDWQVEPAGLSAAHVIAVKSQ